MLAAELAAQTAGVAEREAERAVDDVAAGLLGQQRDRRAVGEPAALGAGLDIGRAGIEGLAGGDGGLALVILDHRGHVRHRRD
ncbi:hypothetical protein, partial [Chromobacterium piscinae]|uniref:hypothetical protein n=1 Tax=Chromobacterium piscinae TaxID=686831 RepID=UPI003260C865